MQKPFMIVGNKVDILEDPNHFQCDDEKMVPLKLAERLARKYKVPHLRRSAKELQDIEKVFQTAMMHSMKIERGQSVCCRIF